MATSLLHAVIIDGHPEAYYDLRRAHDRTSKLHLLNSGGAAMQFTSVDPIQLWLINIHLPDMSGLELYAMLHKRHAMARFLLIGDEYQADEERQARTCGAAGYLCKPPQPWWLEPLQRDQRTDDGHSKIPRPQSTSQHRRHES